MKQRYASFIRKLQRNDMSGKVNDYAVLSESVSLVLIRREMTFLL